MDRPVLRRIHGPIGEIDRLAEHIEHASKRRVADGNRNGGPSVDGSHSTLQTVGRLHRDRANTPLTEVLLHLADDVDLGAAWDAAIYANSVVDRWQMPALVLHIHHR